MSACGIEGVHSEYHSILGLADTAFDLMPLGMFVCDAEGRIVKYNRHAIDLWGRRPAPDDSEARYCFAYRAYFLDGRPVSYSEGPMAAVLKTGIPADGEVIFERPDRSRVVVRFNIAPLKDARGEILGAIGSLENVTEHRRTEMALAESEARFRTLIENLPQEVWLTTPDGTIIYVNRPWVEGTGMTLDEADRWAELIHRDDRDSYLRAAWEAHGSGSAFQHQARIRRADGSYRWKLARALPLRARQGEIFGWLGSWTDIEDIRRAEDALRASEARFRAVQELSLDGVIIYRAVRDPVGRIVDFQVDYANRAALRCLHAEGRDLTGEMLLTLLPGDDTVVKLFWRFCAVVETGRPDDAELFYDANGITGWFRSMVVKLDDDGIIVSFSDITERKEAEARQQLLLHELSHRVKNTLATVQALAQQTYATKPQDELFLERFSARLKALGNTHDLLTQQRWESAMLCDILEQELAPYRSGDRARVDLSGPDVRLPSAIVLALGMVVHELTTNAAKYGALSCPTGRIEVIWRVEPGPCLRLEWRETGGPPVKPPERLGFGSLLIENTVACSLSGEFRHEYRPDGVVCALNLPLDVESDGA